MKNLILILILLVTTVSFGETFQVNLQGSPHIRLVFERKYEVIQANKDNLRLYMLIPEDGQSSAVFGIGTGGHNKTIESIGENYEGAIVKKVKGKVCGYDAEWWHYSDSNHLYSTCYVTVKDKSGAPRKLTFDLVANTPKRLEALEKSFSKLELIN